MSFIRKSLLEVHLRGRIIPSLWRTANRARGVPFLALVFALVLFASCSTPIGSNNRGGSGQSPDAAATPSTLTDLHWCGKPSMLFRDEGAQPSPTATAAPTSTPTITPTSGSTPTATPTTMPTPTTITSWETVKADLGFAVFLPVTLPVGTCLVSAQAIVHDPTLGGNFLIGYVLPDHTSLAISEAPLISQNATFECSASTAQKSAGTPTSPSLQLCSGARNTTYIVLSAQRSVEYMQQLFTALQPDVAWIPGT